MISIVIITILLLLLFYLVYIWLKDYQYWTSCGIPGPKPLPIYGNLLNFFIKPNVNLIIDWYRKYGPIYGIYRLKTPELHIADPELIKQVLVTKFHVFRNRRPVKRRINSRFGKMLVNMRDDEWKRMRSLLNPVFTTSKLKQMVELLDSCCQRFAEHLQMIINKTPEVDIKDLMKSLAIDMVTNTVFGTQVDIYGQSGAGDSLQFLNQSKRFTEFSRLQMFLMTVAPKLSSVVYKLMSRFSTNTTTTTTTTSDESPDQYFYNFLKRVIKQRLSSDGDNNRRRNDLLQILLDLKLDTNFMDDNNETIDTNDNVSIITDDEILSQCFLFFSTNIEEVGSHLAFVFYELALKPSIQDRLRQDCRQSQVFDETTGSVDYENLIRQPYLDACVSETLRKYPPTGIARQAMADIRLDYGIDNQNLIVKKGTIVEIPAHGIHYDEKYYPQPYEYIPDRFMPENRSKINAYTYLPFGVGPRHCIGLRFAQLQSKLVIARLLQRFQLTRVQSTTVPLVFRPHPEAITTEPIIIKVSNIN